MIRAVLPFAIAACLAAPPPVQANPFLSVFARAIIGGAARTTVIRSAARVAASPVTRRAAGAAALFGGGYAAHDIFASNASPIRQAHAAAPARMVPAPFSPTHYREFDLVDVDELEQW
ncbi:MAG: hypothetical protein GVX90_00455 [Alphaproteobacteria bacterium]|jgi:hypothetical protein|nr:hypothetical protein [Alphaproteobacteria bacterium]